MSDALEAQKKSDVTKELLQLTQELSMPGQCVNNHRTVPYIWSYLSLSQAFLRRKTGDALSSDYNSQTSTYIAVHEMSMRSSSNPARYSA